ncbi:hypothetical protein BAV89_000315 [Escherichia coli]|nr:hypothetical protein [Escherichia coli]EFI0632533.1 hypothetical protein [Escherichia coli]
MMAASIAASGSSGEAIGSLFSLFTKFGIKEKNDALKAMQQNSIILIQHNRIFILLCFVFSFALFVRCFRAFCETPHRGKRALVFMTDL